MITATLNNCDVSGSRCAVIAVFFLVIIIPSVGAAGDVAAAAAAVVQESNRKLNATFVAFVVIALLVAIMLWSCWHAPGRER